MKRSGLIVTVLTAIALLVAIYGWSVERSSVNQLQVKADKLVGLCRWVSAGLLNNAGDIERGDTDKAIIEGIKNLQPELLNHCAKHPPVDTNARDWCWVNNDMRCLAREARKLAAAITQE